MKKYDSVSDYIEDQEQWKTELILLRDLFIESELEESLKWSIPTYTLKGKNVAGLAAFKNHVAIWFFNGVFLKDPYQKLINAQEGTTKGQLQWRFESITEINPSNIKEYIDEAITNEIAGKRIKIEKKKEAVTPVELQNELDKNSLLNSAFERFTPFKKREFIEHISSAKRKETRLKRVEKSIPMILEGIGLNDKYRS